MEKGVWVMRWLLLLGLCCLGAAGEEDGEGVQLGPRLPGDPKYWLRLKGISFSEGQLKPAFDGKLNDFELTVSNPAVRSFTMTIRLELQHYDLLALPKILVNGKPLKYSPLNAIVVPVFLNDTISSEDKTVKITLEDPSGKKFGGFLGIGGDVRHHEYNIRCLQPPEFQKVVLIDGLEVKLGNGKVMQPDKVDDFTGQYWYTLPASANGAYLKALCGKYSTSMQVNGVGVSSGSDFWIDMMVPHVTWLVECRYEDARWAQTAVGRTYQVHMNHLQDTFKPPTVRLMPQDGLCEEDMDVEGGIYCRVAHRENLRLITTFAETSEEVFLKKGTEEQNLLSGIPSQITLPSNNVDWNLLVKGMNLTQVPLRMVVAERCHNLPCPVGWVPRPALNGGEDAAIHLCYSAHCNMEDDGATCCREGGTPCKEYTWNCGQGFHRFDRGFCTGAPCQEHIDHKYCCIQDHAGAEAENEQFNMEKGAWSKWFNQTEDHALHVAEQFSNRVEFVTTVKLKSKKEADPMAKVIKKAVVEGMGCGEEEVKVSHFPGLPEDDAKKSKKESEKDLETYAIEVLNFEGDEHQGELVAKAQALAEGDTVGEAVKTAGHELEAKYTSKVKDVRAPRPEINVKMVFEVSKSADLGKGGGGEELAPEVQQALRDAVLAVAEIPDKEKIDLRFKKLKSGGSAVPEDDELVEITGTIRLPPGREGSKQILASKLRNPKRITKKMNKILVGDVKKAEEDPNSRIIGGKRDYHVRSLDVTRVSKTPKGLGEEKATPEKVLKAWLHLTTTTPPFVNVEGTALLRTANGQCVEAPHSRDLGARPLAQSCDRSNGHQAWFYAHRTQLLQNFMGLCLAADLNGPEPQRHGYQDYLKDTHPQVLQGWIRRGGPAAAHLWACNDHWQQQFIYNEQTGQLRIKGSSNPGLCLQTQPGGLLVIALCSKKGNGATFLQQFWLEQSAPDAFLPAQVNSALDVPVLMKPFFDGKVATKSSDHTYDSFGIAPFSQKRAAFYLTQGCSPVPTASCGVPIPDMPNVFVGQSLVKVQEKVDLVPWMRAFRPSPEKPGAQLCVYDTTCESAETRVGRINQFLGGCNAGGKPLCRYCGGENKPCPQWFDCASGGLETGTWSQEQRKWCCDKFSVGCDPLHNCVEGLEQWRDWESSKKMWCCAYEMVACEDECSKKNPALFRENHDYWCSTFGVEKVEPKKPEKSPFELMVMQMFDSAIPQMRSSRGMAYLAVACTLLALASMGAVRRRMRPPSDEVEPLVT